MAVKGNSLSDSGVAWRGQLGVTEWFKTQTRGPDHVSLNPISYLLLCGLGQVT